MTTPFCDQAFTDMKAMPSMAVVRNLIDAATSVTENWESGDLAESVRQMAEILDRIKEP